MKMHNEAIAKHVRLKGQALILGEASGFAKNLVKYELRSFWVSNDEQSDCCIAGFRGKISEYVKNVMKLYTSYKEFNIESNRLVLVQTTFKLFPLKLDFLNLLFLYYMCANWKGVVEYYVVGGGPIVFEHSQYHVKIKDFYNHAVEKGLYNFPHNFLCKVEKNIIKNCDVVNVTSDFYSQIYSNYTDKLNHFDFPLHGSFFKSYGYSHSLNDWLMRHHEKKIPNGKYTVSYIYRTKRKGYHDITCALKNIDQSNISIKVYKDLEFDDLLEVLNNSHVVVDAISGDHYGYLALLALFSGCVVLSGTLIDERYGKIGLSLIDNSDENSKLRHMNISKNIFKAIQVCDSIKKSDDFFNSHDYEIYYKLIKRHYTHPLVTEVI